MIVVPGHDLVVIEERLKEHEADGVQMPVGIDTPEG